MRFIRWISMLTGFAILFAMLPATVAEDEVIIDLGKSVDDRLGLELDEADMTAPLEITIEDNAFELNGLEGDLSDTENEDEIETPFVSNVNGDFEIDEEGKCYWITPVFKTQYGLYGGCVVEGFVITDAVTGANTYYAPGDIPEWVDIITDGNAAYKEYY